MANPTNSFAAPILATLNRGGAKDALAVLESKRQDFTMDYQLGLLSREDYIEMMIDLAEVEQDLNLQYVVLRVCCNRGVWSAPAIETGIGKSAVSGLGPATINIGRIVVHACRSTLDLDGFFKHHDEFGGEVRGQG